MIIDHEYRLALSDADAIALGYANLASYRMAVAREVARSREKADAENGARIRAKLAKQQTVDAPTRFFPGARPKYSGE
jgi:hypothetical protein